MLKETQTKETIGFVVIIFIIGVILIGRGSSMATPMCAKWRTRLIEIMLRQLLTIYLQRKFAFSTA